MWTAATRYATANAFSCRSVVTQQEELLALERLVRLRATTAGTWILMSVPGVDQVGERPLEEMVQKASQQAVVLAREQVDVARRDLVARARQAGPGAAMVSGGVLLGALASGTGTAALILLLARRPRASAAALGVTGAYAGAGALLAREGLVRLREAAPHVPDVPVQDDPVQESEQGLGSPKRRTAAQSARQTPAKSARRTKSAAESARQRKSAAGSARRTKSAGDSLLRSTERPKPKPKASRSSRSRLQY